MQSINLELKACDGSANPYLALAGLILAGMDGVERGLKAPKAAHRDPSFLSEEEKIACGIKPFPATQLEALSALENDLILTTGLGELMTRAYLATRRAENAKAALNGDEWARLETFSTF
jgi:glutamine synthetase